MRGLIEKGIRGIRFRKIIVKSELLSPMKNFSKQVRIIEYRKDPLLERWTRINVSRGTGVKQVGEESEKEFREMIKESKEDCPFCPDRLPKETALFPRNLVKEGRLKHGSFIMFPNLFPSARYHCVGVLSKKHHLNLNEFSSNLLEDCLQGCRDFFKLIFARDPKAKYCSINLNHLPPSGASIIHPHVHIIQDYKPTVMLKKVTYSSREYFQTYKSNYWMDIVESERMLDSRFLFKGKAIDWISAFAPLGEKEVIGVCHLNEPNIINLEDKDLKMMAHDLAFMLSLFHHRLNVKSVNFSLFNGPLNEDMNNAFRPHIRVLARPVPSAFYVNDRGSMEMINTEPVVESLPERIALDLRRKTTFDQSR